MAELILQRDDLTRVAFPLHPGLNRLGRNPSNDVAVTDTSISSTHCELVLLDDGNVQVRDLGSTNGTFVDSAPVVKGILRPGETLRVGNVNLVYSAGSSNPAVADEGVHQQRAAPVTRARGGLRISASATAPQPVASVPAEMPPATPEFATSADGCAHHPEAPAKYLCRNCDVPLCERCLKFQRVGARSVPMCAQCGCVCVSRDEVQEHQQRRAQTFFSELPSALGYPLKGNGLIMLIAGTVFFTVVDAATFLASFAPVFGLVAVAFLVSFGVGYTFAFMQAIVVTSAAGEDTMPPWPDVSNFWDDVLVPFFRFVAIWAACLLPGILSVVYVSPILAIPVFVLGLFCLPMMLLTVSMADSLAGLNPLVIFSTIAKVPGHYIVACLSLLAVLAVITGFEYLADTARLWIIPSVFAKFAGLYGLSVQMRILGLLYRTNRPRFGWFR